MAIRHCDVIRATGQERARRVGVAIAGFVARQDISVGCRDCTCAGTGANLSLLQTGDVESCRVRRVRFECRQLGHRGAGTQSLAN